MVTKRDFICAVVGACIFAACGTTFAYRYYPYDFDHATLVGDKPEHDLPASVCKANDGSKYPCTCLMTPEFFKLKADNMKCHSDLDICQHGPAPSP